ncbi:MAG: polynucleotide adenylyltransferase PcnB [Candidatus Methylomirabilia bacterium]
MRRIISKVVQKLFGRRRGAAPSKPSGPAPPVIVKREEHTISRSRIDEDALKVLSRLTRNNHTAYLVGGGVRDLLLDRAVKDFDIATSAHPQEIKNLFRNCRLIGRRFRLAHILFRGGKVIEVSTFRKQTGFSDDVDLLIKSDNTFGTPEEDARRRDFTINGLFYSITDFSVIDYVDGLEDLKRRLVRTIGDPNIRLREDPIRSLRAIRIAARIGFEIEAGTRKAMTAHREEIWKSATPRIVDEFVRMLNQGAAAASFPLLAELGMIEGLLPGFAKAYADPKMRQRVQLNLASLDAHQKPQGGLPAGLALAVLYHPLFDDAVAAADPEADRGKIAAALLNADLERLKFPRAQLEEAVLLLAGQQRLTQPQRRRGRGGSVSARPWFVEALTLLEITQADSPEGRATLRRLRAQQKAAAEHPAAADAEPAAGVREEPETAGAAGEPTEETGGGSPKRRRRRSRRGSGRGRGRRPDTAAAPAAAEEIGDRQQAPDAQPAPPQRQQRQPQQQRQHAPQMEDRPIDPDAAFGDKDTDLEPPGGESPEERTD